MVHPDPSPQAPSDRKVDTHCPYCALQCAMTLTPAAHGGAEVGGREFPTNRGGLCRKGWTSADLLTGPGRLTTPLVRRGTGGPLLPATWEEALDRAAEGLRAAQARGGPDAVAVFGGGGLTNEKAYAVGKFARVVLRTSQVDYNGRFCMSSAAAGANKAFGLDRGLPFPLEDLGRADCVLLVGSNVAETMPPFMSHLTRQRENGGSLVVVDPRRTPTAAAATLHLQPQPGTDLALALGLLNLAVEEGLVDKDYLAARTTGFEAALAMATSWWPARVELETGVAEPDLRRAIRLLGNADRAMILTARGAEQHSHGTDTVSAFINLALALGLPGQVGSGWGCITGQGNGQGGREHGQKADQLPGYRMIDDPAARAHVAGVWGIDPADLPGKGRSAYELLDALGDGGGPSALLLLASNPVVSAPNARHVAQRIASLDFLVVADLVLSETARLADVVLPTAQWAEESGTMTNLEGRVLLRQKALDPPDGVRTDLHVLQGLAERLGTPTGFPTDPVEVFEELRRASAGGKADYAGVTHERLAAGEALHWPCPSTDHPGTPRLFLDAFATPDGLARFVPVDQPLSVEPVDEAFPLLLTTGRVAMQYQSGAQTRLIPALNEGAPRAFVEVHPRLAERLEVADGERVRISTRRGESWLHVRVTDTIREDTVFVPFHWAGKQRANSLTSAALDPTSRMPAFKVCAARIDRLAVAAAR
ncbi:MAG: molybdopterin dinucleotide binding protein [Frankiales bacterium]|nr:molybdopterin dinucleotide binding protein [Frankiales bacterium]